ncbi:hypothetical protein DFJ74DRAFT_336744 [Hyaloraphidium curvatum]|nr:hypothetical protein DFJ74DRAFT_336744 [Hyaloraphidium curvatum]
MARGEWIGGSAAAGGATRRIGGATPPSAIAATSSGMPTGLPLVDAADDAEVQRLLESGCRVGQTGANGNNALHYFASKGHLDTRLKLALDHAEANEPDALNAPNGSDQTPFFIACQSNRPGAVRLLLDCQGVDVTVLGNIGTSYRRSTGTPLVAALQNSGKIDDEQWRPREVVAALVSAARDTSREPSRRPSLDLPAELSNQLPDWARTLLGGSTSNPKARTPTKKATATRQVPTKKKSTATGEPGRAAPETDSEDSDNEGDPAEVPMPQAPGAGNPLSFRFMTWNVNGSRSHGVADPDDYRAHSLELLVRGPNPPDLLLVQELKKGLKIAPQAGPILDIAGYDLKSVEESSPNAQGVRRLTGRVNGIFNREGLGLDPVRHHRLDAFVLHLMQERDVQLRNLAGAWAALGPLWNDVRKPVFFSVASEDADCALAPGLGPLGVRGCCATWRRQPVCRGELPLHHGPPRVK